MRTFAQISMLQTQHNRQLQRMLELAHEARRQLQWSHDEYEAREMASTALHEMERFFNNQLKAQRGKS